MAQEARPLHPVGSRQGKTEAWSSMAKIFIGLASKKHRPPDRWLELYLLTIRLSGTLRYSFQLLVVDQNLRREQPSGNKCESVLQDEYLILQRVPR